MRPDPQTQASVEAVLDRFADAYARRDVGNVLEMFVPDASVMFIGTGSDEKRRGLEAIRTQIERDLAQGEQVHWNWVWDSVSIAGSVAWVAADAIMRVVDGRDMHVPVRLTAVLQREGSANSWRIAQMHVSTAVQSREMAEEYAGYPCD